MTTKTEVHASRILQIRLNVRAMKRAHHISRINIMGIMHALGRKAHA